MIRLTFQTFDKREKEFQEDIVMLQLSEDVPGSLPLMLGGLYFCLATQLCIAAIWDTLKKKKTDSRELETGNGIKMCSGPGFTGGGKIGNAAAGPHVSAAAARRARLAFMGWLSRAVRLPGKPARSDRLLTLHGPDG